MKAGTLTLILASSAIVLAACGESSESSTSTSQTPAAARPTWLLASAPADPVGVTQLKQTASEGEDVIVRGIIGGRVDALSEESAVFVMMDAGVQNRCTEEGDDCATPWDYCCMPPAQLIANNATVQLVDDSGAPLTFDLRTHGIEPLDTVIVVGTIGTRPTKDVLTIKATSIYREQG